MKNNVYPCNPQFYYIKVGFEGVKIIWACFRDGNQEVISLFKEKKNLPVVSVSFDIFYL